MERTLVRPLLIVGMALAVLPAAAQAEPPVANYYCNAPAGQPPDRIFTIDQNGNVAVDWALVEKHKKDKGCGVVLGALSAAHRGTARPMGAAK